MERLLTNDRHIAYHRNKLDVKAFPSDKLNIAYLDEKFNQFLIHLLNSNDDLKIQTLKEIKDQLQDGDEVFNYSQIHTELMKVIFELLKKNPNKEIREYSSLCFKQFCRLPYSQLTMEKLGHISDLKSVFYDEEALVRLHTIEGLIFLACNREGQEMLLRNKVLEEVITKIDNEKSELVLNGLMILSNEILKADAASKVALERDIVKILKKHINFNKTKIRISVFINFGSLSISEHGKEACTNEGDLIINSLKQVDQQIELLEIKSKPNYFNELDSINILIALTRFQNTVSILKRGKVEIYENKGLESYLKLLKLVKNEQIIINILQVIGNTGEEPRARKYMLGYLKEIEAFIGNKNEFINRQAQMTKDIITWKP